MMRNMRFLICGMIAVLLLALAQPAAAQDGKICYEASGDVAIAACSRAIASGQYRGQGLASLYYNRGTEYKDKEQYDRAITDFNEALRLNPKYPSAYNNRGIAYYKKGDHDRAIADYTQAINLEPKSNRYYNRGLAWRDKGDKNRAIADFTEAERLGDPDAPDELKKLGR